jgi:hypothetical protein
VKYAKEVIDLLGAYPGRRFKMRQILNHVSPRADGRRLAVVRTGVWRALQALEESGQVVISRPDANGAHAEYWWKSITSGSCEAFQKPQQYVRAITP